MSAAVMRNRCSWCRGPVFVEQDTHPLGVETVLKCLHCGRGAPVSRPANVGAPLPPPQGGRPRGGR
jgi:hypothetical protein